MMGPLIYALLAILILILVALLASPRRREVSSEEDGEDYARGLWEGPCLSVVERVFDPADYLWLRNEVGFPNLARSLAHSRRDMALKWLKALRRSFGEVVRTPEPELGLSTGGHAPGSWHLLWLTLRFHLFLTYAVLVVRFVGPYHRLVPPFSWVRVLSPLSRRAEDYQATHLGNLR